MAYTLYNADCRNVMSEMLLCEQFVDCMATDPPYRLTSGGKPEDTGDHRPMRGGWMKDYSNDGSVIKCDLKFSDWLPQAYKVLKSDADIYVMANDKNMRDLLNAMVEAGFGIHNILVWDKRTATANRWYMKNCEFTVYGWKGKAKTVNFPSAKQLIYVPQRDETKHPTEKPVSLFQHYIENSTQPREWVFDPFMGSGTTGVACESSGRNFIGAELDKKWFDVAVSRLSVRDGQVKMWP